VHERFLQTFHTTSRDLYYEVGIEMPILASLIARSTVVLVEQYSPGTSFPSIARRLLEQIPSTPDSKKSYSYESYNFHYLVEGGITYICMSDQAMGYRVPYSFLFDLNNRFKGTYGQKVQTAGPMAMNDSFGRVLTERMDFFSNDKSADKISKVKGDIDEVKKTMVTNIEKVLERSEKIEVLVDKTDELHTQSQSFRRKGTKLKQKMWWKNAKLCCCIIVIIAVIIAVLILTLMAYFGVFPWNIFGRKGPESNTTPPNHPTEAKHTADPTSLAPPQPTSLPPQPATSAPPPEPSTSPTSSPPTTSATSQPQSSSTPQESTTPGSSGDATSASRSQDSTASNGGSTASNGGSTASNGGSTASNGGSTVGSESSHAPSDATSTSFW